MGHGSQARGNLKGVNLPALLSDPRKIRPIFRVVAIAEAFSWAALLVGMYFKWIAETTEAGVKIFGPIHGGIFIAYVVVALLTARSLRWSPKTTLIALASSIPPFATAVFEVWALRQGKLDAPTAPAGAPTPTQ